MVENVRKARGGITPRMLHEEWLRDKAAHGWKYGESKDAEAKTHPCMVPYWELPREQRDKNWLFVAIVDALTGDLMPVIG